MSLNSVYAQEKVKSATLTRKTISLESFNETRMPITIVPLFDKSIEAGTTLAESSISILGDTIKIYRPATTGEDRAGILAVDVAKRPTVSTPPIQEDLVGGVMFVRGTFKTENIIDEGTAGTLQAQTLAMKSCFFK